MVEKSNKEITVQGLDSDLAFIWDSLGQLWRKKVTIVAVTVLAAIASIVISLVLPKGYLGSTRLLLPEGGSGGLAGALLGDVSDVAESFIGGGGDYKRYLSILTSRTAYNNIVEEFDLEDVYETTQSVTARSDAIDILKSNVDFVIDDRYEFLTIEALDRDPQRAAGIANAFAHQLNIINSTLSSQSASQFREFVEKRLSEAFSERDSLQAEIRRFREQNGILDLPVQLEAFYTQLGEMRAEAAKSEIQYEALRTQLGPNNPQVLSYKSLVTAAEQNYQNIRRGREPILPVEQDSLPALLSTYADLELSRIIQDRILEVVAPLVEQARFDEQKQFAAVQVVDVAIPPQLKSKPQRSVIVVVSTFTASVLACLFVFLLNYWQRNGKAIIAHVLNEETL